MRKSIEGSRPEKVSAGRGLKGLRSVLRKARHGEKGFTMVELLIVMIVSLILIAGMIGLIEMATKQLTRSRALESVTDSARRALGSIDRQVKQALQFDDANCSDVQLAFWGDVDSDNTDSDVERYTNAEYVRIYKDPNSNTVVEAITQPPSEGGRTSYNTLCSYVTAVHFFYFAQGVSPEYSGGTYTNGITSNYNSNAGMVKTIIDFSRTTITRKFEQDSFLRILDRTND